MFNAYWTGSEGTCISIRECPDILQQFVDRQKDPEYIAYIRKSNTICGNIQPHVIIFIYLIFRVQNYNRLVYFFFSQVCCPSESTAPTPATRAPATRTTDVRGRLLSVEEGCGFSNKTHTRIVGGEPAMKGIIWLNWNRSANQLCDKMTFILQVHGRGWHWLATPEMVVMCNGFAVAHWLPHGM